MPVGSASLGHPQLEVLPVGTELWHIHPERYAPTAFNPKSANRFAAVGASPARGMYYAGATPEVALWETLLRNVIADVDGAVALDRAVIANWHLAAVRTVTPVTIIDLAMPRLRLHVASEGELATWQELQRVYPYAPTHAAARELLSAFPDLGGLCWMSKQAGNADALIFYDPPATSPFEATSDRPVTFRDVDAALAQAGIRRIPTDPATLKSFK